MVFVLNELEHLNRTLAWQSELGLMLYQDEEAVRHVLADAGIGEQVEQAIISLDQADKGPYLQVSRAGKLLACFAHDAPLPAFPLIEYQLLLQSLQKLRTWREHLARAQSMAESGEVKVIIDKVFKKNMRLSREDISEAIVLQPLLGHSFLQAALRNYIFLDDLFPLLSKIKKVRPGDEPVLARDPNLLLWPPNTDRKKKRACPE